MQDPTFLEQLPEAALLAREGRVVYVNAMARHYLPQLEVGAPLPSGLDFPIREPSGAGTFTAGLTAFTFRMTVCEGEQTFLFHPAPQCALTDLQLEGALAQLRQFMGEFAAELGPYTTQEGKALSESARTGFLKSFHRAFRLLNNLDYLRQAGSNDPVPFQPTTLDLAGLCRQLSLAADDLLSQTGTRLHLDCPAASLLIPGDPKLLQRLLLGLIANSARAARGGTIHLEVCSQRTCVRVSLRDSGPPLSPRQIAAMLQQDSDQAIPLPGQGAGMGLAIARHIVTLHKGTMLVEWGSGSPALHITLPMTATVPHLTVESPSPDSSGGLSPLFVELADVLPAQLFAQESLD